MSLLLLLLLLLCVCVCVCVCDACNFLLNLQRLLMYIMLCRSVLNAALRSTMEWDQSN